MALPQATPIIDVAYPGKCCWEGWGHVVEEIKGAIANKDKKRLVLAIECHPGTYESNNLKAVVDGLQPQTVIETADIFKEEKEIKLMASRYLVGNQHIGRVSSLEIKDFFDEGKRKALEENLACVTQGIILVFGIGASQVLAHDLLIYADMSRYEVQQRFRRADISNIGVNNRAEPFIKQYHWSFFIDWRISDMIKKPVIKVCDYFLDTNNWERPRLALADAIRMALKQTAQQPFFQAPFFDPELWDGRTKGMPETDFHWYFTCVQEENSVLYRFGDTLFEIPAINVVFYQPRELLGSAVYRRFGSELPIRFDFIDTLDDPANTLEVYPEAEYIHDHFGVRSFQDESYYVMATTSESAIHLGLKQRADIQKLEKTLRGKSATSGRFPLDRYLNKLGVKRHDYFSIPPGMPHSTGSHSMLLRITSAPHIFSFKLWEREGNEALEYQQMYLKSGLEVSQVMDMDSVSSLAEVASGEGWTEEKLGGYKLEFIEKRRHRFTQPVEHQTGGTVNVVNLVEGEKAIVESPDGEFAPFIVHYSQTFVVPASVSRYRIRPHRDNALCVTVKAYIQ